MIDWPISALILTPIVGIVVLLLNRILGNERIFHTQWKVVLFILGATLFQVSILGREYWGVSSSGLFRLDGFNTHLLFCYLFYMLLTHISLRFEKNNFESETAILQLAFTFAGIVFILANNLILYVAAAPMTFLIAGVGALCNSTVSKSRGFRSSVMSAMMSMSIFAISAAIIGQSTDALELNTIIAKIGLAQKTPQFYVGWALHIMVCFSMLLLPPTSLFIEQYKKSESWALVGFFRMSLPLLGLLLLSKWIFLTGFSWGLDGELKSLLSISAAHISASLACLVFILACAVLLTTDRVILFSQVALTALVSAGLLFSILSGVQGFLVTQSALYIYIFCSCLLHLSLSTLKLSTAASLQDLRDALQKAPVSVQLGFLFSLLGSAPFLTFVGFDINKQLIERTRYLGDSEGVLSLISLILMGIMTVLICNRVVELYFGNARRNSFWDDRGFAAKMWGYTLIAFLLILGIYPTPLYKYLSHSINLFVKNA